MSGEWKIGLFGCFKDVRLCVVTLILPCYTVGRIAQHFGEDCVMWGLLSCIGCNPGVVLRWRLREQKKLNGTMMKDVLIHAVLPCCALIQEAYELNQAVGTEQAVSRQ